VREGVPVWLCTVAVGMLIRGLTGAGTAFSFVIVAAVFLGAMLLGWRAVRLLSRPRRALKQRG
jgi:membrane protein implicated in regulation of membrane protease activity